MVSRPFPGTWNGHANPGLNQRDEKPQLSSGAIQAPLPSTARESRVVDVTTNGSWISYCCGVRDKRRLDSLSFALHIRMRVPAQRPLMTASVARVLIVDPDIGFATRLSIHLQRLGFHVATAITIVSAERVASELRPDVVIADDQYGAARLQSLRAVLLGTEACGPTSRFICVVRTAAAGRSLVDAGFDATWLKSVEVSDFAADVQASFGFAPAP